MKVFGKLNGQTIVRVTEASSEGFIIGQLVTSLTAQVYGLKTEPVRKLVLKQISAENLDKLQKLGVTVWLR